MPAHELPDHCLRTGLADFHPGWLVATRRLNGEIPPTHHRLLRLRVWHALVLLSTIDPDRSGRPAGYDRWLDGIIVSCLRACHPRCAKPVVVSVGYAEATT